MNEIVGINDLVVRREKRVVLDIERLSIEKGKVLAVVGPNGAGKTTLLLVMARLLNPECGEIRFGGQSLEKISDLDYRRHTGLVMQDSLLLNRTVFDNVAIGLRFRHVPNKEVTRRVEEWLECLGISHLRHRSAPQLSSGEARRVSLARALALRPELLLLDEPFSALDRASRQKLQEDLKDILAEAKTTTVFSTHSETDVLKLADWKIELDGGKLAVYD